METIVNIYNGFVWPFNKLNQYFTPLLILFIIVLVVFLHANVYSWNAKGHSSKRFHATDRKRTVWALTLVLGLMFLMTNVNNPCH